MQAKVSLEASSDNRTVASQTEAPQDINEVQEESKILDRGFLETSQVSDNNASFLSGRSSVSAQSENQVQPEQVNVEQRQED